MDDRGPPAAPRPPPPPPRPGRPRPAPRGVPVDEGPIGRPRRPAPPPAGVPARTPGARCAGTVRRAPAGLGPPWFARSDQAGEAGGAGLLARGWPRPGLGAMDARVVSPAELRRDGVAAEQRGDPLPPRRRGRDPDAGR